MITVNLRPDLKRKRARRPLAGVAGGRARRWAARVKDPLLLACRGELGGRAAAGWASSWSAPPRELNALEPQLEQTRAENKRFKAFLAEKRHQETIRDSLVAQIGVIRTVDGDRYVWPHLLDEVTKALPAYTWLVDMGRPRAPRHGPPPAAPAAGARPRPTPPGSDSVRGPALPWSSSS